MRKYVQIVILVLAVAFLVNLAQADIVIADIGADWVNSVQGQGTVDSTGSGKWYYGWYNSTTAAFDNQAFTTANSSWDATANRYVFNAGSSEYQAVVGDDPNYPERVWMHPGMKAWAVVRWVSNITGKVTVLGNLANHGTISSVTDGVSGYMYIDGTKVPWWKVSLRCGDNNGIDFTREVDVVVGTTIEFGIHADGVGNYDYSPAPSRTSYEDGSNLLMQITTVPEPATVSLLLAGGVMMFRRRKIQD